MLIYRTLAMRQLRKRRGVSAAELAAEAGLSIRAVRALESGTCPRADTLGRLASALGVRVDAFYREADVAIRQTHGKPGLFKPREKRDA